jgi:peroxiredoxin
MKQLPSGVSAPDFELQALDGRRFRLSESLQIDPVVLVFYKMACPTCQLTLPYIQRIFAESGASSGVKIWGISQDEAAETRDFVKHFGIGFDVLIDEHPYKVSSDYRLEYVPGIFIVGTDGKIQLSDYGFSKAALTEVARVVAQRADTVPPQMFHPQDGLPATRPG